MLSSIYLLLLKYLGLVPCPGTIFGAEKHKHTFLAQEKVHFFNSLSRGPKVPGRQKNIPFLSCHLIGQQSTESGSGRAVKATVTATETATEMATATARMTMTTMNKNEEDNKDGGSGGGRW